MSYNFEEEKNRIREDLKARGYVNKKITYQEFLELYEPYKQEMSEKEFAEIIGLTRSNWINIRYRGYKTTMLKTQPISEERKQEIQEELEKKGYKNRTITYQEFLKLHELYINEMREREFAVLLGINLSHLYSMKNKGKRTVILKSQRIPKERQQEVQEELKKQGYGDRVITYQEFLELYEPYKNEIVERDFAELLGINCSYLNSMKNRGNRAVILKSQQISKERLQEVQKELKEKGYEDRTITYQEFLELYEPYKNEIVERDFAEILGLSDWSWNNLRNNKIMKTKILKKKTQTVLEERKQKIQKELKEQGYENRAITYQEFLELYEPYKNEIVERDFAEILGISYINWYHLGSNRTIKTKIQIKQPVSEEVKQEIQEKLKEQGYENRAITYQKFLKLYEPYKNEMAERDFAEILGINYGNLGNIRHKGNRAKILKTKTQSVPEDIKQKIQEKLKKKGYEDKAITYQEFLELYEPYKNEIVERDFAEILGISHTNWYYLRNSKIISTKILKTQPVSEELKQEIQERLKQQGYENRTITYQEFLKLYEQYKNEMAERDFAEMLGINHKNWHKLGTNRIVKIKILKTKQQLVSEERRQEIQEKLKQQGYEDREITCQEFLKLYEPYKSEMVKRDFAAILGINQGNWYMLRSKRTIKTMILKTSQKTQPVSEERRKKIQEEIKKQGYEDRVITYQEFLELYEPYKNEMNENDFAETLGITYPSLNTSRKGQAGVKINLNYRVQERIKYLMREPRVYTKEEIEQLGTQYGISVEEVMGIFFRYDNMFEVLKTKGKIFIGTTKIDDNFMSKYGEELSNIAHSYSRRMGCKLLRSVFYAEDIAQETLINTIEHCGAYVINLEEQAEEILIRVIKASIKYKYLQHLRVRRTVSLDENFGEKGTLTRYEKISTGENIQEEVEEKEDIEVYVDEQSTPIGVMQECILKGMDRRQAIEFCMKRFKLTQKELLDEMTRYLEQKKKIRTDKDGNVYLGDDR